MLEYIKNDFNHYLESLYVGDDVNDMISYSLVNEGKRIRPLFFFAMLKGFGLEPKEYYDIGAAIEMIHTYSLVHDDLPAMDNDDYRHGKLTSHKKFGEANAILVGDALLSDAFLLISNSFMIDSEKKVSLIKELSESIGSNGMVRGQFYDLANENNNSNHHILDINYLKTTKLLSVPFIFSIIIANRTELMNEVSDICDNLGLAFQIQDDILDYEGSFDEIGKTPLKDINSNKRTYVNQFGIEKAKDKVRDLYTECFNLLKKISNFNDEYLYYLINLIKNRRK